MVGAYSLASLAICGHEREHGGNCGRQPRLDAQSGRNHVSARRGQAFFREHNDAEGVGASTTDSGRIGHFVH